MLPNFLQGTYNRYKRDTRAFTKYIIDTAAKCGHKTSIDAKKEASKATKSKSGATIGPKELRNLTDTIVQSNIEVPQFIIATARRAIGLRKKCAGWFSKQDAKDPGNARHSRFIDRLEELCELLESKVKPSPKSSASKSSSSSKDGSTLDSASNRFAHLALDDNASSDPHTASTVIPDEPEVDLDDSEEDQDGPFSKRFFGLFCLFEDLLHLRKFIGQCVNDYVADKIDLSNLAVVTDTAVHLAKELIDEVLDAFPELQQEQQAEAFMYLNACAMNGEDPGLKEKGKFGRDLPYNSNMADFAEWCYLPTSIILLSFREVLQPQTLPVAKKGHFGTYDPKADRKRMSPDQRFNEDMIILLELLPEFTLIQLFDMRLPVQDQITKDMVRFVETKRVPLSLCFAAQLFLDIHHGLRSQANKAYNELRFFGMRASETIEEYWEFSKTFTGKPVFWSDHHKMVVKDVHGSLDAWVIGDVSTIPLHRQGV